MWNSKGTLFSKRGRFLYLEGTLFTSKGTFFAPRGRFLKALFHPKKGIFIKKWKFSNSGILRKSWISSESQPQTERLKSLLPQAFVYGMTSGKYIFLYIFYIVNCARHEIKKMVSLKNVPKKRPLSYIFKNIHKL